MLFRSKQANLKFHWEKLHGKNHANSIFKFFVYLFICLCCVLVAACGIFYLWHLGYFSCGLWDLYLWHVGSGSLTRDRTQAPCIGSMEFKPLDHEGSP